MTDTQPNNSSDNATATDAKPPPSNEMSDIEKIKAAHAARRAARRRPPRAPASPSSTSPDNANGSSHDTTTTSKGNNNNITNDNNDTKDVTITSSTKSTANDNGEATGGDATEIVQLREELKRLNLEMKSLHRNHLHNIRAMTAQRDMFAEQLAREQQRTANPNSKHGGKNQSSRGNDTTLSIADVEAQLRAARIRNSDLEAENTMLRDEVKQLNFRVQASKTLDAASNGYQQVVDDLVAVKLKCAQLSEEKEDLLRINKELTTTSNALSDSNGDLEKSRAQWVMQCAEVEKKRTELEKLLKEKSLELEQIRSGRDEARSDLQELKL